MREFNDKVAVITGAASGIGLGLAHQCVLEGMKVVLADIDAPELANAEEKLKALILQHVKWELSLKWPSIGLTERRNLPPKLLKDYLKLRDEYEAIFRRILQERIQEMDAHNGNLKLYSLFTLGLLNSFFHWYKPKGELSLEQIADEAYRFINKAISPQSHEN